MKKHNIFISYSRSDSDFVIKLEEELTRAGIDIWLDQKKIAAGKKWDWEIGKALNSSGILILVISPNSAVSDNVADEVQYASDEGKIIVPILIEQTQVPFSWRRYQRIDFYENYEEGLNKLAQTLKNEMSQMLNNGKENEEQGLKEEAENKRKSAEEQILKLKAEAKQKAEEESRIRTEAKAKEENRRKEKAKATRIEKEKRIKEEHRIRAEAEAKQKAEEESRIRRAEANSKEENSRIEKAEAKRKRLKEQRLKTEKEAKQKAEEEKRLREKAKDKKIRRDIQNDGLVKDTAIFNVSVIANKVSQVKIGTQIWMTKNLDVSSYRNGDHIPEVKDPKKWARLTTGAWRYYNNDPANGAVYGKLYNWYAVNDPRGLAPEGWHIPTDDEWTILTNSLGGEDIAGGKLKESGTTHWESPNEGATNKSGFSALPGGCSDIEIDFAGIRTFGLWWSSTEGNAVGAWGRFLHSSVSSISRKNYYKDQGFSVRCVGTQTWMTKNLEVSSYRNGDPIPEVKDPKKWKSLTTGAWCYYNNDPANGAVYGKLYNWYAVNDARGLAPKGWHIPTDDEWTTLTNSLGGENIAGGKLKEPGTNHWESPNEGATNEFGFSALPGGSRDINGGFISIRDFGYWWSSTEGNAVGAWVRRLIYNLSSIYRDNYYKVHGFSVRCVRD